MDSLSNSILFSQFITAIAMTVLAGQFAKAQFPVPAADKRIGCVDGLRGYLAIAVMFSHFDRWILIHSFGGTWDGSVAPLWSLGDPAVTLFFMTTGLVFYPRIRKGISDNNWISIYISRFFRLIPLITFSTLCALLIACVIQRKAPGVADMKSVLTWISSITQPPLVGYDQSYTLNAGVLWSIKFEWLFYLAMLPALAFIITAIKKAGLPTWLLPLVISLLILGGRFAGSFFAIESVQKYLPLILVKFSIGMLAFEMQMVERIREKLRSKAASILALACLLYGAQTHNLDLMNLLMGVFFVCVACGNSMFGLLRLPGALVLGECSFGIYLMHGLILFCMFTFVLSHAPARLAVFSIVATGILVTICCALTYLWIERPCIRFGRKIAQSATRTRTTLRPIELEVAP